MLLGTGRKKMLNSSAAVPLYVQLKEKIEQKISNGEYKPGEKLQTEGERYDLVAHIMGNYVPQNKLFKVFEFDITSNGTAVHQLNGYVNVTVVRPADLVIGICFIC